MTFFWYKLPLTLTEFMAEEIPSKEIILLLETIGRSTILLSRGNMVSMTFQNVFLPLNFPGLNPYIDSGFAGYLDTDNNIWLGVEEDL